MAVSSEIAVRKANAGEIDALARTLARAFYDDPVLGWTIPDDARRLEISDRMFRVGLNRIWLQHEETYAADGTNGVAIWMPPGTAKLGIRRQLALAPSLISTFGRCTGRVLSTMNTMDKHHPSEEHYYLPFVGVDPDHQRRGIGSAVLRPVLQRCDDERVPAYLEASSEGNRALYERNGFVVMRELRPGRGAPPLWPMWREPR